MAHESDVFSPSTRTLRSPPKISEVNQLTEVMLVEDSNSEPLKRKRKLELVNDGNNAIDNAASVISNEQLSNQMKCISELIASSSQKHSDEILSVKADLSQQIQVIAERVSQIETNVVSLDSRVEDIKCKYNVVSKTAQTNKALINNIMQESLSKCMDIDGVSKSLMDEASDLKALTLDIISSFNIAISDQEIERVSKKDIKKNDGSVSTLLMVHFRDFDSKIRVMRAKRSNKESRNIYFNASLTPLNKYFMMNARKTVKNAGLKVFFKSGKVYVEKANKQIFAITCDEDLAAMESYVKECKNNRQVVNVQKK